MDKLISSFYENLLSDKHQENTVNDILDKVNELNNNIKVEIRRCNLSDSENWYYDESIGVITNINNSFFQIMGLKCEYENVVYEQPIIIQDEIGYLGIICKVINNTVHFLMQFKIEPGNVNNIQISPTIQATKSNFTQLHGGRKPAYLDYFLNSDKHAIIIDQIQSEQSSRFNGKRNRNTIILITDDIEVLDSHCWITFNQIKDLMKFDNIINMDTRTVISCIPISFFHKSNLIEKDFKNNYLFNSIFSKPDINKIVRIYHLINNYKMLSNFKAKLVPLYELKNWCFTNNEFICKTENPFKVIFCNIAIEGREVTQWTQPLFEAIGKATFGLLISIDENKFKFLVKIKDEVGCFDKIEIGPTLQIEAGSNHALNQIEELFFSKLQKNRDIISNVVLSEEGGRFYHEQNNNIIIKTEITPELEQKNLPEGYFWIDYSTLNHLVIINNCLNIQLRNLLSLLEF